MAQTTIDMDAKTLQTIEELRGEFHVKTNSQVIRRALALARFAAQQAKDGRVTLLSPDNEKTTVFIAD